MQCLALKRAYHKCSRETFANTCGLRQVKVAATALGNCQQSFQFLVILAPEYVRATVQAVVVAATAPTAADIVTQYDQELDRYLHPLTGGPGGRGWEFGQRPYESDLYALLESIRGLEYVQSLSISLEEERPGLLESGLFLICAGEHSIRLGL